MMRRLTFWGLLIATWWCGGTPRALAELFVPGDRICLVGNAFGERMQHCNHFETLLYQRFPRHRLVLRNLCFPGDEVDQRLRSWNFGSPDDHLRHSRASVVLFFFGYNESFSGPGEVERFADKLRQLVRGTRGQDYSGDGPPRMVLISPQAFEATGDPHLPTGELQNRNLAQYRDAMRQVAQEVDVAFVDLFAITQALYDASAEPLTINGFHLNDAGYAALAPKLLRALCGDGTPAVRLAEPAERELRREIADKNFHWWHRYRAVNGYSIYGKRNRAGFDGTYRNVDVMERERAILDQMCAHRDERIWELAQGKSVAASADDRGTLPFLQPKTNVKGAVVDGRDVGPPYLTAEQQQERFEVAPGFVVDLVATEEDIPLLANPVAMNFDRDGRLWVSTMPSYPQWKPKTPLNDRLLILTDRDEMGRYHGCQVFADGLHQPTGFELGHGGVFVAQQPDVLFLRDGDGDDVADERERILIGFDTADSHHGLAAFEWGPGGGLYFQEGTFKQSQVETWHGVERLSDAGIWRFDPRTRDFRVFVSVPFANPWGHVFDDWGQNFVADASDGLNYWAAPMSGKIRYPHKHPGGWIANKDWDKLPLVIPRHIRPTSGCELVASSQFPLANQGNYLLNNVIGFQGVLQYSLADQGAGFAGTQIESLISCKDGNFRPVDLQFGPDGALYIVDWHNALIGHLQHNLRDPHRDTSHGRIWRVRHANRPLANVLTLSDKTEPQLLASLVREQGRTAYRVRRELAARDSAAVLKAVEDWLPAAQEGPAGERAQLEALWLHQAHNRVDPELLQQVLTAKSFQARAAAVRVLSFWIGQLDEPLKWIRPGLADAHPRVRLEAVRACSFLPPSPAAAETVLEVLNQETDAWIEYTLEETLRELER